MSIDSTHQGWLGLPLALAPGLAASAALLVVALTPAIRSQPVATRSASLDRRSAWTVGSRRAYLQPTLAAVVLAGLLLVTGLTATTDDAGLNRALSMRSHDGMRTASPYPGWFYAAPLLAVAALLLLTATLAMRRIARLPAVRSTDERGDRAWRRTATSAISLLATSGLLGYLAGVLLVTGSAVQAVGEGSGPGVLGGILQALALLIGVLACVCFGLAVSGAAAFPGVLRGPAPLPR
jgi:hypothetical protein